MPVLSLWPKTAQDTFPNLNSALGFCFYVHDSVFTLSKSQGSLVVHSFEKPPKGNLGFALWLSW